MDCDNTTKAFEWPSFFAYDDSEFLQALANVIPDEIEHLRKADTTVEIGKASVKRRQSRAEDIRITPSEIAIGSDYPEVNRTLVSMLCLKWIVTDDYESFTKGQAPEVRLTALSWKDLRLTMAPIQSDPSLLRTLSVLLIISDLGKDPNLTQDLDAKGERTSNHDELVLKSFQRGELDLTRGLPNTEVDLLRSCLEIGASLNIPQLLQGENVPGNLTEYLNTVKWHAANVLNIKMMEVILDVAGAAAATNANGAVAMTDTVYQTYRATMQILRDAACNGEKDERAVYLRIIQWRSKFIVCNGLKDAELFALLRLFAIGRVAAGDTADAFHSAYLSLESRMRDKLTAQLNKPGLTYDNRAIIPYYSPGVCSQLMISLQDAPRSLLIRGLAAFMTMLTKVCDESSLPSHTATGTVVERDCRMALTVIHCERFRQQPEILGEIEIPAKTV